MSENEFNIENEASVEKDENINFLALAPQNSAKAIEKLNTVMEIIDKAKRAALQRTVPQDWVCMGGKYYPQATAVEKIRSIFGLYFVNMNITKEDFQDGNYAFICKGTAGSTFLDKLYGKTIIEIEGCRSSGDQFFSKQAVTDPMDVRKSSYANFQVRAAKALLGLGNYTAEDLKAMGVNVGEITNVKYEKGAEGGGNPLLITDGQANRLYAICKSNNMPAESIKKHLKDKYGINSSKDIKRTDYKSIVDWVEAGGAEQPKEGQ